jgi:hypothetical protein
MPAQARARALPPAPNSSHSGVHRKPSAAAAKVQRVEAKIIEKNGYTYELDPAKRFKRVTGILTRNNAQGRSGKTQRMAGVPDRLPKDHGGHIIARRFNGPKDWFNHFAQDGSFNQRAYARLENIWDKALRAGQVVRVDIRASYEGLSRRPNFITVYYWIDGKRRARRFPNAPQEKRDD